MRTEPGCKSSRDQLLESLRLFADIYPALPGHRFGSAEDLVLTYGRWFTPSRLPIDRPMGSRQRCFANVARHSREYDLFYVEGYATANSAAPFPHAWCSRPDSTVEDPTWNGDGTNYFGIPFTADFIRSRTLRRENGPLLFDQHLTGWQLLHGGIPDGAIAEVGQPHS